MYGKYMPTDPKEWEREREIAEAPIRQVEQLKEIVKQLKILNHKGV